MKNFLMTLTLLTALVACKNSNTTPTALSARKLPFDNNVFLTIPHQEGQSQLRKKLLNITLASELNTKPDFTENEIVTPEDKFIFNKEVFKLSPLSQAEYQNFKENSVEIVVSYTDHQEIYFVPVGISREKALRQLNIVPGPDARFFWINVAEEYLNKGKTYYLLSSSIKEMKENDIHFNHQVKTIGQDFHEKYFSFANNQIVNLKISADYKEPETVYALAKGRNAKCTSAMREAGICDPCEYKIETPTGALLKRVLETSDLIDLDIVLNGRSYPLKELKPTKDKEGNFIVSLDLKKLIQTDMATMEFKQNAQYPVSKKVEPLEYLGACAGLSAGRMIDVTPVLKVNLELDVLGRFLPVN